MPVTLKDLGVLPEKRWAITRAIDVYGKEYLARDSSYEKGFEQAIDSISDKKIGLNREKLAKIIYEFDNTVHVNKHIRAYPSWDSLLESSMDKCHFRAMADAIISNEHDLLEVK